MATDKIKNSLKFTIERAQNGFIITQVRFNDKTKQFEEVKEVVLDGSVNQRIGQLLQLEKLDMAVPLVYLIDVIMEKKYKEREDVETDEFMLLKMRFVKFKKHNPQNLAGLMIDDRIEMLGDDAVIASKYLQKPLEKIGGVNCLFFETGPVGNKEYARLPNREVITTSNKEIEEWGKTHSLEKIVTKNSDTNDNDNKNQKK